MTPEDRFHHFRVVNARTVGRMAEVWMDGRPLQGVKDISVRIGVMEANEITLTLIAGSINAPDVRPLWRRLLTRSLGSHARG